MAKRKYIQDGMKKNEIRVEHNVGYDLGRGRVWVKMPHRTSFNPHEINFQRSGRKNTYTKEIQESEISTSTFHGSPDDAVAWAKAILRAAKEARRPVSKKELDKRRKEEETENRARDARESAERLAENRRKMTWAKNEDGTYSELNGLFTIVPNNDPQWKEQSKKWLVRGPQFESRSKYFYDKKDKSRRRKDDDYWEGMKNELSVKTVEEGQEQAQSWMEEMISHYEYQDRSRVNVPLLREKGQSGEVVMTDELVKRMKKAPLKYRENKLPEEVTV